jgi:hypothetical protein
MTRIKTDIKNQINLQANQNPGPKCNVVVVVLNPYWPFPVLIRLDPFIRVDPC